MLRGRGGDDFSGDLYGLTPLTSGRSNLQVIPSLQGDASEQAPPDLPSFLFKERIVYLVCLRSPVHCPSPRGHFLWAVDTTTTLKLRSRGSVGSAVANINEPTFQA